MACWLTKENLGPLMYIVGPFRLWPESAWQIIDASFAKLQTNGMVMEMKYYRVTFYEYKWSNGRS